MRYAESYVYFLSWHSQQPLAHHVASGTCLWAHSNKAPRESVCVCAYVLYLLPYDGENVCLWFWSHSITDDTGEMKMGVFPAAGEERPPSPSLSLSVLVAHLLRLGQPVIRYHPFPVRNIQQRQISLFHKICYKKILYQYGQLFAKRRFKAAHFNLMPLKPGSRHLVLQSSHCLRVLDSKSHFPLLWLQSLTNTVLVCL